MKYVKVASGAFINLSQAVAIGVRWVNESVGWAVVIQLLWVPEGETMANACTWKDGFLTEEDANTWLQIKLQEVLL